MNSRAFLLVMICLAFVGIWSGDSAWQSGSRDSAISVTQTDRRMRLDSRPVAESASTLVKIPALVNAAAATDKQTGRAPLDRLESVDQLTDRLKIDLPPGIAQGQYHVISNSGRLFELDLSDCDLSYAGIQSRAPQDVYVSLAGRQRWYFVRQGQESVAMVVPRPAATTTAKAPTQPNRSAVAVELIQKVRGEFRRSVQQRLRIARERLQRTTRAVINGGVLSSRLRRANWSRFSTQFVQWLKTRDALRISSEASSPRG